VVAGAAIASSSVSADVTPTGQATGYYVVNMGFTGEGGQAFGEMTTALYNGEGATGAFGIVLDGLVISAPEVQGATTNGEAQISGNFSQDRKSTRLNSSHVSISYAVFCLKKQTLIKTSV